MNDWRGPIGLDFARKHPERVKRLVIANTWCWPVGDDFHFKWFSFLMSSCIGQYLLRDHNLFVNRVMPRAVGDRSALTPEIMAHYRQRTAVVRSTGRERRAAELHRGRESARGTHAQLGASDWLRSVWQGRAAYADKPALILWGLKDIAFRRKELERRKSALQDVGPVREVLATEPRKACPPFTLDGRRSKARASRTRGPSPVTSPLLIVSRCYYAWFCQQTWLAAPENVYDISAVLARVLRTSTRRASHGCTRSGLGTDRSRHPLPTRE